MRHRRWPAVAVAVAALIAVTATTNAAARSDRSVPSPARLVTITIKAKHGAVASTWLDYPGPPRADVLLPAGYNAHRRYPLLVLLNALGNDYSSYAENGIVTMIKAARLNAIVVMPEGGSGWYADWWNGDRPGHPAWETYELDDVIPTIMKRYPIRPGRRFHAIAGFSMGGLGAAYLGGRLPGFFGSVASLSGFVDPHYFAAISNPGMGMVALAPLKGSRTLDPVYGPPNGFYADGHNPARLSANLRHTRVFESTGTGVPSGAGLSSLGAGEEVAVPGGSVLESLIIEEMNQVYHHALVAAGVHVTYQVHVGGHDLPDFYREFAALLAWGLFKPVARDPTSWVNDTVAARGRLWGLHYRFAKPPSRVVRFRRSGNRLSVSSAGSAVTISAGPGCRVHASTPVTIHLGRRCR